MKKFKVSAPGKIHLMGEHAVVYRKPALLTAINKRVFVEIESQKNKQIEIIFEKLSEDKLVDYVKHAIYTTVKFYNKSLPLSMRIIISTEVPIGSGMGSSAASAVAIAGAVTLFLGEKFDKEKINEIAFLIEKYNHGNPSGGDNSASCFGGFIWYKKPTRETKIIQHMSLKLPDKILNNFFLINTGKPKELTAEMVGLVKKFAQKNPALAEKIFDDQEIVTISILSALKKNDEKEIIKLIKEGEDNLEKLGVVSDYAKSIIREIELSGGVAKICGAGGKIREAGVVLVYHKDRGVLENLLNLYNLSCFRVAFGEEGIRIEK